MEELFEFYYHKNKNILNIYIENKCLLLNNIVIVDEQYAKVFIKLQKKD